jgi:hypothetical protein
LRRLHFKVDLRFATLSLALFVPLLALAQVPVVLPGPGDTTLRRLSSRGFGKVSGIVLSDATGKPLKRAQVILKPLDADGSARLASTSETGVFEFAIVKAGRYTLVVQRDGYLSIGGNGSRAGGRPEEFSVSGNTALGSFVFRLHPAAVIAGSIKYATDAEPAVHAVVELYREFRIRGRHGFEPVGRTVTDDRGEYRLHDVPPGSYFIAATRQRPPEAAGAVEEPRRDSRGRPLPDEAWAVTFYPSGQKLVEAVPVKIAYGTEAVGIDIFLEAVPSTRIRGRVTSALGGVPDSVSIVMHRADSRDGAAIRAAYDVVINKRSGAFEITGVTAGPYVLIVDASDATQRITARRFLEVTATPVDNVELLAEPLLSRRGHITIEGAGRNPAEDVRIALEPRDESAGVTSSITDQYGRFRILLQPGVPYDAIVSELPKDTYVKSVRFGSRDVLRDGLTEDGENEHDSLDVVLATDGGQVTGNVVDRTGKSAAEAQVTLIPDPSEGRLPQYASGAVTADGSFKLTGVAPGRYLILASPADPPCDIYDSADLGACRSAGQPIEVSVSGQALIALQLP